MALCTAAVAQTAQTAAKTAVKKTMVKDWLVCVKKKKKKKKKKKECSKNRKKRMEKSRMSKMYWVMLSWISDVVVVVVELKVAVKLAQTR